MCVCAQACLRSCVGLVLVVYSVARDEGGVGDWVPKPSSGSPLRVVSQYDPLVQTLLHQSDCSPHGRRLVIGEMTR